MSHERGRAVRGSEALAIALLGATAVTVVLLLVQAAGALRSHERTVAAALEEVAGFLADRVATELDATFASVFLDRISAVRSAHYAWQLDGSTPGPEGLAWAFIPAGAVPAYFSLDGDEIVIHDGDLTPAVARWVRDAIRGHASTVYPAPAPYAVVRPDPTERLGAVAVVYRKETAYEGEAIYGFLLDFARLGPVYASVMRAADPLPSSLAAAASEDELASVRLTLAGDSGRVLFEREGRSDRYAVRATAYAAKAGRLRVDVELASGATRALLPGGTPALRLPLLLLLSALSLGLLAVAVRLTRRHAKLHAMREDLLADVSHDLRTPLAQIRMFSETLLLDRLPDEGERRRSLEVIRRQAEVLSAMVDRCLDPAGPGAGRLEPRDVDVERTVVDAVEAVEATAEARESAVECRVEGPAVARVDPVAVRRIVTNLLDNALKHGPSGQRVRLSVTHGADELRITVDDQGPGVRGEDRSRVWRRFSRLAGSDRDQGSGLGLAVVRDLAERHGGSVRIEDAPGGGARVVARLAIEGTS